MELPLIQWLVDQIKNDDVCKVLAAKYNEVRKARIHGDTGELEQSENRLQEIGGALTNIANTLEQCPDSPTLLKRLVDLEREQKSLQARVKSLRGVEQSSLYVTPSAIKQRFGEIPKLLLHSEPFEVTVP